MTGDSKALLRSYVPPTAGSPGVIRGHAVLECEQCDELIGMVASIADAIAEWNAHEQEAHQ